MTDIGPEIFGGRRSRLIRRQADQLWDRIAQRYAEGASGEVTLVARDVLVPSAFLQRGLPALWANPEVTALRLVDPATGEEQVLQRGEF